MSQHLVLIDDTDPSIQYSGPWFKDRNTYDSIGTYGPPFENTLHGVNVSASLSFSFSGSSVTVLGTIITTDPSWSHDLAWNCFVDNTSIISKPTLGPGNALAQASTDFIESQNSGVFCQDAQLQDGPHVLSVQVTVSNQQTFWFDQIQYLPSSNVSLDQALVRVNSSDPALQYSSGWQGYQSSSYTQTVGSSLTYEFSGKVSISWVGIVLGKLSSLQAYSIDGQTPINFTVLFSGQVLYNQVFFQAHNLSAGNHKLVVMYKDNPNTEPLSLDYLILQNAPSPSTSLSSSTASASTISSSTSSNSMLSQGSTSKDSHRLAIVGGVLGGLILLLLILLFLIRRARKSQWLIEKFDLDTPDTYYTIVQPFTLRSPFPPTTTTLHLPQMMINHKPSRSRQPTIPITPSKVASTSPPMAGLISASNSRLPDQTPLLNHSASPSEDVPLTSSQANLVDDVVTNTVRGAEMVQRSSSSGNARFLRHEDSGIRMPPAEEEIVELPPLYTPG